MLLKKKDPPPPPKKKRLSVEKEKLTKSDQLTERLKATGIIIHTYCARQRYSTV